MAKVVASHHGLATLLRASKSLFKAQINLRDRLYASLLVSHQQQAERLGFEVAFTLLHTQFNENQKGGEMTYLRLIVPFAQP
jgi:hypothetical protein